MIMSKPNFVALTRISAFSALVAACPALADSPPLAPAAPAPSYADLADLADSAPLVIRLQPRKVTPLEPARARGVKPGWARLYVEAKTEALIGGRGLVGEMHNYLVDVPLDAKGKPPSIKKKSMVVLARPATGLPGALQLVASDAQIAWDPQLDVRLRRLLGELYAPGAPQKVTAVREANHVPGNLAGEGETQIFLTTANGEPAAINVMRSPGAAPRVSVSFSEIVADTGLVPPRDTLAWYRLACFLPGQLPFAANVSGSSEGRARAAADYQLVIDQLGSCPRTRK